MKVYLTDHCSNLSPLTRIAELGVAVICTVYSALLEHVQRDRIRPKVTFLSVLKPLRYLFHLETLYLTISAKKMLGKNRPKVGI